MVVMSEASPAREQTESCAGRVEDPNNNFPPKIAMVERRPEDAFWKAERSAGSMGGACDNLGDEA